MGWASKFSPENRRRGMALYLGGMVVGGFLIVLNSLKMWLVQATMLDAILQIGWTGILVAMAYMHALLRAENEHAPLRSLQTKGRATPTWVPREPSAEK